MAGSPKRSDPSWKLACRRTVRSPSCRLSRSSNIRSLKTCFGANGRWVSSVTGWARRLPPRRGRQAWVPAPGVARPGSKGDPAVYRLVLEHYFPRSRFVRRYRSRDGGAVRVSRVHMVHRCGAVVAATRSSAPARRLYIVAQRSRRPIIDELLEDRGRVPEAICVRSVSSISAWVIAPGRTRVQWDAGPDRPLVPQRRAGLWIFLHFLLAGWPQLNAAYEHGLAEARSQAFYDQYLFWPWMRLPGRVVFSAGALIMGWDILMKLRRPRGDGIQGSAHSEVAPRNRCPPNAPCRRGDYV